MLLMQNNVPAFLGLPPPEGHKPPGVFEPGGRFKDELTIERVKNEKGESEKRDIGMLNFEKFNWSNNFHYKDLNQLLGRHPEMAPRRPDVAEAELRHLEMEMEVLRSQQRRRELVRRNSSDNTGKPVEMNGKLPDYLLPMSPQGKPSARNPGPLNVSFISVILTMLNCK